MLHRPAAMLAALLAAGTLCACGADVGSEITIDGQEIDCAQPHPAYDFFLSALPAAGYEVAEGEGVQIGPLQAEELSLSGNGWSGTVHIAGAGDARIVDIKLQID